MSSIKERKKREFEEQFITFYWQGNELEQIGYFLIKKQKKTETQFFDIPKCKCDRRFLALDNAPKLKEDCAVIEKGDQLGFIDVFYLNINFQLV